MEVGDIASMSGAPSTTPGLSSDFSPAAAPGILGRLRLTSLMCDGKGLSLSSLEASLMHRNLVGLVRGSHNAPKQTTLEATLHLWGQELVDKGSRIALLVGHSRSAL